MPEDIRKEIKENLLHALQTNMLGRRFVAESMGRMNYMVLPCENWPEVMNSIPAPLRCIKFIYNGLGELSILIVQYKEIILLMEINNWLNMSLGAVEALRRVLDISPFDDMESGDNILRACLETTSHMINEINNVSAEWLHCVVDLMRKQYSKQYSILFFLLLIYKKLFDSINLKNIFLNNLRQI